MEKGHVINSNGNGLTIEQVFEGSSGITCDDMIVLPTYSAVKKDDIKLRSPFLFSSPMDTVTEWRTAVQMALHGAMGLIHFNMSGDETVAQVKRVRRFRTGFIYSPECRKPSDSVSEVYLLKEQQGFSTILVTEDGTQRGKLVGMVMKGNVALEDNKNAPLSDVMIPLAELETRLASEVQDLATARAILRERRSISKLPLLNLSGSVYALVTREDVAKSEDYPHALMDENEQLQVGAAVSTQDEEWDKVKLLVDAGVSLLVIDSAQGSTEFAVKLIRRIRKEVDAEIPIMAGNVVTPAQAKPLIEAGATMLRVGMGSGSICTTQDKHGIGRALLSAVRHISLMAGVSVIADGGIRTTADMLKAFACGAQAVMVGRYIVGCDETPAEVVIDKYGRHWKRYRGMGSASAIAEGGFRRYGNDVDMKNVVVQGVEGLVPACGSLDKLLPSTAAAIRKSLEYVGCSSIDDLHERVEEGIVRFDLQSVAARAEGHPHDISSNFVL